MRCCVVVSGGTRHGYFGYPFGHAQGRAQYKLPRMHGFVRRSDGDSGAFWRCRVFGPGRVSWVEGNGERKGEAAGAFVAGGVEGAGAMS